MVYQRRSAPNPTARTRARAPEDPLTELAARIVSGGILAGTRDTLDAMAAEQGITRSRLIGRLLEARAQDLDAIAASCQRMSKSPDGKIITVSGVIAAELRWSIIRSAKAHGVPVARIVAAVIEEAVERKK